jgi:3-carboxy-cis,cis-muconate cycloisomerase
MTALLRDRSAASADMRAIFDDAALLRAACRFEAALANAQAAHGILSRDEADAIIRACAAPDIDIPALAEAAAHAGTLAIPLVAWLRARGAAKIHLGSTSQDLADTALMLQSAEAATLMGRDLQRLAAAAAALAATHASTPMLGRTLLQPALPITFGLKAASWTLSIDAALNRFRRECSQGLMLQFGGAAGTRAGLDSRADAIALHMAHELGLACPILPWHARRDAVAGLAAALAIASGAIGKIARDISLLAQAEVAEAFEPREPGRGGSSAMAHKRNPTGCQVALSAHLRAPGLAATIFAAMPQEHERGLGGWQAEGAVLADLFCLAHGAVAAMIVVLEELDVDTARMAANLQEAAVGDDFGESAGMVAAALAARENNG